MPQISPITITCHIESLEHTFAIILLEEYPGIVVRFIDELSDVLQESGVTELMKNTLKELERREEAGETVKSRRSRAKMDELLIGALNMRKDAVMSGVIKKYASNIGTMSEGQYTGVLQAPPNTTPFGMYIRRKRLERLLLDKPVLVPVIGFTGKPKYYATSYKMSLSEAFEVIADAMYRADPINSQWWEKELFEHYENLTEIKMYADTVHVGQPTYRDISEVWIKWTLEHINGSLLFYTMKSNSVLAKGWNRIPLDANVEDIAKNQALGVFGITGRLWRILSNVEQVGDSFVSLYVQPLILALQLEELPDCIPMLSQLGFREEGGIVDIDKMPDTWKDWALR